MRESFSITRRDAEITVLGRGTLSAVIALLILCLCSCAQSRQPATSTLLSTYKDPLERRIEDVVARMSVEEKIGQLFMVYFKGPSLSADLFEMIDTYHVGGIILFNSAGNIEDPAQVAGLINSAQHEALTHGARLPLLVAVDQEGGRVVRLTKGVTVFPGNMAIGASGSLNHARLMAATIAKELKAVGINMNLAPVLDVNSNPDNPIIGIRSFGSSPLQVADFGAAMIDAYRIYGIIATAKHFPGHGDTAVDSHVGLPVVPHGKDHLESVELLPFRRAIEAGVPAIMSAHVVVPSLEQEGNLPATLSKAVLSGLLRERMGFTGLIVTDSLGMGAIRTGYGMCEAARMAFQAGADILLFGADGHCEPQDQIASFKHLCFCVNTGSISMERLDESVRRILRVKMEYGLFRALPASTGDIPDKAGTVKHRIIAELIARDSITLVRDEKGFLPLNRRHPVMIVWTYPAEGHGTPPCGHTSLPVTHPLSLDPSDEKIDAVVHAADSYPCVVVGTYDARHHPKQQDLLRALSAADTDLIVVGIQGPYDLICCPDVPCYMAIYGAQQVSLGALARVIFGAERPRGKLPVDLPGLYPRGHGLLEFNTMREISPNVRDL